MAEPGRNLQVELCVFHPGVGDALARALLNALDLDRQVTRDRDSRNAPNILLDCLRNTWPLVSPNCWGLG